MIYRKFLPILLLFAFVLINPALAQRRDTISINNLVTKAVKYTNDFPTEKVYLHFDKPYYSAGDTIFFKAYVTIDLHLPTVVSKVAYVELFNSQDSSMARLRVQVLNGVGSGSLVLPPDKYKQGNYRLRAYTNWMLNFDPAYLFTKIITIGNPVDKDVYTQVSYGLPQSAQSGATVRVQFKEKSGVPYADKKVSWRVEASHDETAKGRVNTDAQGYALITLPPSSPLALSSSTLHTDIDLGNQKHANNSFSLKAASPGKDVQFFPEGGDLVVGVPSRVAVKAIKSDGLGIGFKGVVTDNAGTQVTTFESQHLGMGVFSVQPEAGKTYKVAITFADGSQGNYNLPRIQTSGITMALSNADPDNLGLRITANDAYFQANQNKVIYVVAQTGGFIKYAAQTTLQKQVNSVAIPKSKFNTGVLQVTLSGDNGIPICERLVFIKKDDLLKLTAATDKPQYTRRGTVKLNINAKNPAAAATEANLSVAVVDERKIPVDEDAETTILSSLLLTSDLKGYIEKPNYYFRSNDEKTQANLDMLMMTQGYRRFSYRDVVAGRGPKISILPEQGITITGTLRDRTGLPQFKKNVTLQVSDKNFVTSAITNSEGQFRFDNVMLNDSSKVTISARNNVSANNLMLMIDGSTIPGATRIVNLPDERQNIDSAMAPYLENTRRLYENSRVLREVVIKSTAPVKKPSHLDQASLTGLNPQADHFIDGTRFKGCNFFVSCLQSSALGVTYVDNNFYITRSYNQGNRQPMAVFVDGLQVDQNFLQSIQSAEVESVEVFNNDGLSGINRRDNTVGVLVINKKKAPKGTKMTMDQLRELIPPPYIASFVPGGYATAKEFYMPKYLPGKLTGGIDLRSTIYWNPKVITDKTTGSTTLQYFNSDGAGTYRVVVEGIDKDGNIGRQVIRYKVQ